MTPLSIEFSFMGQKKIDLLRECREALRHALPLRVHLSRESSLSRLSSSGSGVEWFAYFTCDQTFI